MGGDTESERKVYSGLGADLPSNFGVLFEKMLLGNFYLGSTFCFRLVYAIII